MKNCTYYEERTQTGRLKRAYRKVGNAWVDVTDKVKELDKYKKEVIKLEKELKKMKENIKISKKVEEKLVQYDWDINEVKLTLVDLFPNANYIRVIGCDEGNYITCRIDGKKYDVYAFGEYVEVQ